jgi:predicted dehydrogenase
MRENVRRGEALNKKHQSGAEQKPRKVRYAVVGLGYISQIAVLPAFANARENSDLTALVSGDPQKLKVLASRYKVDQTYSYEGFGECLKSGGIDAVYIALPNHMHRAYAEGAAAAGIHILCEKPMAFSEADCLAMIDAAKEGGVKLMIAYRLHLERGNLEAIEVIKSGKIGEPRIFTSVFSQQVKAGNSRLQKKVGGGALYDMGIYCINAARYLFGAEPLEVFGWNLGSDQARFSEVPEMTSGIIRFPGDRVASLTSSFGAADRSVFEIIGTKGVLKMDPAYEMVDGLKSEITVNGKTTRKTYKKRDQFAPELVYFSDCILKNKEPQPSGREGLADVRIIEALLKSAASNRSVEIPVTDVQQRPSIDREISRPAVSKPPALVNAASPSAGN